MQFQFSEAWLFIYFLERHRAEQRSSKIPKSLDSIKIKITPTPTLLPPRSSTYNLSQQKHFGEPMSHAVGPKGPPITHFRIAHLRCPNTSLPSPARAEHTWLFPESAGRSRFPEGARRFRLGAIGHALRRPRRGSRRRARARFFIYCSSSQAASSAERDRVDCQGYIAASSSVRRATRAIDNNADAWSGRNAVSRIANDDEERWEQVGFEVSVVPSGVSGRFLWRIGWAGSLSFSVWWSDRFLEFEFDDDAGTKQSCVIVVRKWDVKSNL